MDIEDLSSVGSETSQSRLVESEIPFNVDLVRHNGKWVHAKWHYGKKVEGTGFWDCCGNEVHYKSACLPVAERKVYEMQKFRKLLDAEKIPERMRKAQELREAWEKSRACSVDEDASSLQGNSTLKGASPQDRSKKNPDWIQALERRGKKELTFEAKMVKEKTHHRMSLQSKTLGLGASALEAIPGLVDRLRSDPLGPVPMILQILANPESNRELQEHCLLQLHTVLPEQHAAERIVGRGGLEVLVSVAQRQKEDSQLVEHILHIVSYLAHAPETQHQVTSHKVLVEYLMNSIQNWKQWDRVLNEALSIFTVMLNDDSNVKEAVSRGLTILLISSLHRHKENADLLQVCFELLLRLLCSVKTVSKELLRQEIVSTALRSLSQHSAHPKMMVTALKLLLDLCEAEPDTQNEIMNLGGVALVFRTLQALVHDEELQLQGLMFLEKIAKDERGMKLLDEVKGSWQWLTQGCGPGDRLLGLHQGHFHDLSFLDRALPRKSVIPVNRPRKGEGALSWSVQSLKTFMGFSAMTDTSDKNNLYFQKYFQLVKQFNLLPTEGESQGNWFTRLKRYQQENNISIDALAKQCIEK